MPNSGPHLLSSVEPQDCCPLLRLLTSAPQLGNYTRTGIRVTVGLVVLLCLRAQPEDTGSYVLSSPIVANGVSLLFGYNQRRGGSGIHVRCYRLSRDRFPLFTLLNCGRFLSKRGGGTTHLLLSNDTQITTGTSLQDMRTCRDRKPMAEWGSQMGTKSVAQSIPGRLMCSGRQKTFSQGWERAVSGAEGREFDVKPE